MAIIKKFCILFIIIILLFPAIKSLSVEREITSTNSPYIKWSNGPSTHKGFFPIGVWLQQPKNAARYKEAGINFYVGLWKGPTENQLFKLKKAGMKVICTQNEVGLKHINDPTIIGWMQKDEPDNAKRVLGIIPARFTSPVSPEKIVSIYKLMKSKDPSRPVFLNLGQGVAWDGWRGRGFRTNHPVDYPDYIKGTDIVSFDIYPAASMSEEVKGKLWLVSYGVKRLKKWSEERKIIWNLVECTGINNELRKVKPWQIKNEVWASIINGSKGIIYFVHQWKPKFNDAALLSDPEILDAVTEINRQIRELAPVLNSPDIKNGVKIYSMNRAAPLDFMVKKYKGYIYIFAAGMRDKRTGVKFKVDGLRNRIIVEVPGERRSIKSREGYYEDNFRPWDVHIYRIKTGKT